MGLYFLVRWRKRVNTTPDLVYTPCFDPAGKLYKHILSIHITCNKKTDFENGLIADKLN